MVTISVFYCNNNTPQLREESRRENFGENNDHGETATDDDVGGDAAVLSRLQSVRPTDRPTVHILMTAVNDGTPFPSRDLPPSSLDSRHGFKAKKMLRGCHVPYNSQELIITTTFQYKLLK